MLKHSITVLFRQFTKSLNQFSFYLSKANINLHAKKLSLENILINGYYLKNARYMFAENYCMLPNNFYITVICNKTATQKDLF